MLAFHQVVNADVVPRFPYRTKLYAYEGLAVRLSMLNTHEKLEAILRYVRCRSPLLTYLFTCLKSQT